MKKPHPFEVIISCFLLFFTVFFGYQTYLDCINNDAKNAVFHTVIVTSYVWLIFHALVISPNVVPRHEYEQLKEINEIGTPEL